MQPTSVRPSRRPGQTPPPSPRPRYFPFPFRFPAVTLLAACYIAPAPPTTPPPAVPPAVAIEEFVRLTQSARRRAGCPELVWDARAAAVARAHSEDMFRRNYFSHTSPEGVGAFDRMRAAGIVFSAAAENIVYAAYTGEQAFRRWIGSAGHRRNLLDCRYVRHGVGVAGDRWTHVLYAP